MLHILLDDTHKDTQGNFAGKHPREFDHIRRLWSGGADENYIDDRKRITKNRIDYTVKDALTTTTFVQKP